MGYANYEQQQAAHASMAEKKKGSKAGKQHVRNTSAAKKASKQARGKR